MNKREPTVVISVVNYNGWEDTLECLRSIERLAYPNYIPLVIDNNSRDDSVAQINKAFPHIEVVEMQSNRGYAAAANEGIKFGFDLQADFCLLLNNDVILDQNAVSELIADARQNYRVAAVGPKILDYTEKDIVRSVWASVNLRTGWAALHGRGERDDAAHSIAQAVDGFLEGAALMLVSDAVRQTGLLDETYFMFYEDSDWCYRARREGFQVRSQPKARVWHKSGRSVGPLATRLIYYVHRNRVLFEKRFASRSQWLSFWTLLPWHTGPAGRIREVRKRVTSGVLHEPWVRQDPRCIVDGILDGLAGKRGISEKYQLP
jgi:GT2 family glycosyltransferase